MSTDFEDRIARLNAKHGPQTYGVAQPARTAPRAPASGQGRETGTRPVARYVAIAILALVVLPLAAATATLYHAKSTGIFADAASLQQTGTLALGATAEAVRD